MLDIGRQKALDGCLAQLAAAHTLEDLQAVVRSAPRRLVGATGATFVLREGDHCFYADEDAASPLWKGQRFPLRQCISGWAMLHGQVAVIPDIRADERIPQEAYRPTFVRSLVMLPIGEPPVAAMGCYWDRTREATMAELWLLGQVASAAAEALRRIGTESAPRAPVLVVAPSPA